jgi:hypothetical protein
VDTKVLRAFAICTSAAAVLVTVSLAHGAEYHAPPAVAGYPVPTVLLDGQLLLEAPGEVMRAGVDESTAIDRALQYSGLAGVHPTGVSVQLLRYTNRTHGTIGPDGSIEPQTVGVLAYVVRFTGVPQHNFGLAGGPENQELNVVLDAVTGQYIEMFSYK